MPSDPITKIISSFYTRLNFSTSGIEIIPAVSPDLSPKQRVIANPGKSIDLFHTRNGPIGSPEIAKINQ